QYEGIVHHVQGLRRDRGYVALTGDQLRIGHVEQAEELRDHPADNRQIRAAIRDLFQQSVGLGPAANFTVDRLRGRAVGPLEVEASGDVEHGIANGLRVESAAVHAPDERVV